MSIFNNINGNDPFGALQIDGVENPGFPNGFQNGPFSQETEETEPKFHTKGIDFNSLIKKLKNSSSFNFKYNEFLNPDTIITPTNPRDGMEPFESRFHIPAVVNTEEGKRALELTGRLNKKEGILRKSSRKSLFRFELKVNDTIGYIKKIKYANNEEIAIEIISASYNDYRDLSVEIGIGNNSEVKTKIKNKFNTAFRNIGNDLRGLKWLYENAPTFVLNQRGDDILIQDLKKLLTYDTEGTFSWFKDSSSAIINLLLGFKDLKKVYDHFYNHPDEVIRLYSALEGEKKENFIFLLTSLSHIFWKEPSTDVTFMIGPNFKLDSNILIKDNQKEIYLQGYRLEKNGRAGMGDFGMPPSTAGQPITYSRKIEQPKTKFHPLELVALQNETTGEREVVCALQVKSLSDKAEWNQVVTVIEIVVVVIAIIASAGVLAAPGAAVAVTVIAAVELVVSVADLVHIFKRANLDGTEEEDWFVKNWPEISLVTGVVSISTVLRRGLLKHGPKALGKLKAIRNATSVAIQKKIITLITEIQVELYFFFKRGVVLVSFEPFTILAKSAIYSKFAKKMEAYGVLLTKPAEGSKIRALMYNGQKIEEGTDKELKVVLKEIFPFGGKSEDILKVLDEYASIAKTLIKINSVEELIKLLGKLNSSYKATYLEKTGIKVLFRGTTKNVDGSLFKGNTNSQINGISTSTDPLRAILFAIESASKPFRKGFIQVVLPKKLKGIRLQSPNQYHFDTELEVIIQIKVKELSKFIVKEIPVEKARELANKFFNLTETLPTKMVKSSGEARWLVEELPKSSLETSFKFYEELLKL